MYKRKFSRRSSRDPITTLFKLAHLKLIRYAYELIYMKVKAAIINLQPVKVINTFLNYSTLPDYFERFPNSNDR